MTVGWLPFLISLLCVGRAGFCDQRDLGTESLALWSFGSDFQGRETVDSVVQLE